METIFSPTVLAKAPEVDYRFLTEAAKLDPLSFEFDELFKATKLNKDRLELELAAKKHEYEMAEIEARKDANLAINAAKKREEVETTKVKLEDAEAKKKALSDQKVAKIQEKFRKDYPTTGSIFTQTFDFADDTLEASVKSTQDAYNHIISLDPTQTTEPELIKNIREFEIAISQPGVARTIADYNFLKTIDGKDGYIGGLVAHGMEEFMRNGTITNRDKSFYTITGDEKNRLNQAVKTLTAAAFSENVGVERVVGGEADVTRRNLIHNGLERATQALLEDPIVGPTIIKMSIIDKETPEKVARKMIDTQVQGIKLVDPGTVRKDKPDSTSKDSDSKGLTSRENQNKLDSETILKEKGVRVVGTVPGSVWPKIGQALVGRKPIKDTPNGPVFADPDLAGIELEYIDGAKKQTAKLNKQTYTVPGRVRQQMINNIGISGERADGLIEDAGEFTSTPTKVTFTKKPKGDKNKGNYRLAIYTTDGKISKAFYYNEIPSGWKLTE